MSNKWYAEFDPESGRILKITPRSSDLVHFIEVDPETAYDFRAGKKRPKDFKIVKEDGDWWLKIAREIIDNQVVDKQQLTDLLTVPETPYTFKISKNGKQLTVNISFKSGIDFSQENYLYITKKGDPTILYEALLIDPDRPTRKVKIPNERVSVYAFRSAIDPFKDWNTEGLNKVVSDEEVFLTKNPGAVNGQAWRNYPVPQEDLTYEFTAIIYSLDATESMFSLRAMTDKKTEHKLSEVRITWPDKWLLFSNDNSSADFEIIDHRKIKFKIRIKNPSCPFIRVQIWPAGFREDQENGGTLTISNFKLTRIEDEATG